MREKGQSKAVKTLETPVFSRGIEILTEKNEFHLKNRLITPYGILVSSYLIFPFQNENKVVFIPDLLFSQQFLFWTKSAEPLDFTGFSLT